MKKHIWLGFSFIASLCLCATSVSAQANPAAVAQELRSTDPAEQARALQALRGVAPGNIDPAVRQAVIDAAMRQNRAGAEKMQRIRSGTARPSDDIESGLNLDLLDVVVSLRDPETIPVLLGAFEAGIGGMALYQTLAEFGEPAAGQILDAVTDPASSQDLVSGGLTSLRLMVELSPGLSAATLETMTLAAERYLNAASAHSASVLIRAIDLAAVLSDPRLDEILRALVSDPVEVEARVVERAQRALARVPPLPRAR